MGQPMEALEGAHGAFMNTAVVLFMGYHSKLTAFLQQIDSATIIFMAIIAAAAMYVIWQLVRDTVAVQLQSVVIACEGRYFLDILLLQSFRNTPMHLQSKEQARRYVPRPALEDKIRSYMGPGALKPNGRYLVLYGARGVGKSTCMRYLADSVPGAVMILVRERTTEHAIMEIIADTALFKGLQLADFLNAMRRCTERLAGNPHPVIVFYIWEYDSYDPANAVLALVRRMSKHLSLYCHVVVILPDPYAALVFNTDPLRQMFLCVEEPSSAEAAEMCAKLSPPMPATEQELGRVFALLGTRPGKLINLHRQLVRKETTVDQYIEYALEGARSTLTYFPHPQLIAALRRSPSGVHLSTLRDVYDNDVPLHKPALVAPAIRRLGTVLYDVERGEYRLQSRALVTALTSLGGVSGDD